MKILVTGGAGFIGRALCTRLADQGHALVILDDLSRSDKSGLEALKHDFLQVPLSDRKILEKAICQSDVVYHLAAVSQVIPSIQDPGRTFVSNVQGTYDVASLCSKYKKHLIFSSSREVYGNPEQLPCSESAPLQPANPYAASKIAGESFIQGLQPNGPFPYSILRISNAYGPGDRNRVVPLFVSNALLGKPITIFGSDKILDLVYVQDVVDALVLCLKKPTNRPVNIGSGRSIGLEEMAKTVLRLSKSSSTLVRKPARAGEVDRYYASISTAQTALGWKPATSLEAGLAVVIASAPHKASF